MRAGRPGDPAPGAHAGQQRQAGGMAGVPRVVVQPPSPSGGRRVRVDGVVLGVAYGPSDLREFLRRAGLADADEMDIETSPLIEWRGGGPDHWPPSAP